MNLTSPTLRHLRRPSSIIVAVMACATWLGLGALVSASAQATSGAPLKITTLTTKSYGTILESTRTVYTLAPSKVACTATCLKYWPEVLLPKGATKAVAGPGVAAAKLGTIKRAGGRLQVTYAGKALYWFFLDKAAGQVKGNVTDTWGKWSVVVLVKPAGGSTTTTSVATTTTTTGGGGGGIGF